MRTGPLVKKCARLAVNVADYHLLRIRLRGFRPPRSATRRRPAVLIVKLDAIGDYVIFSRTSWIYRHMHPECEIVLLCQPPAANLAEANRNIDRVIPLDVRRLRRDRSYQFAALRRLRAERFEVVYQPTFGKTFWSEAVVRLLHARKRVAVSGANHPKLFTRWYLSGYDVVHPAPGGWFREVDVYDSFARRLCADYVPRSVDLWFDRDAWRLDALVRSGRLPRKPYCVLFSGASAPFRRWPTPRWIALERRIASLELALVLAGSDADRAQNRQIARGLRSRPVFDVTGETTLRELAALIAGATLLISVETSAVHLAAHLSVPQVCILGGGHYGRFYPYGDPWRNRAAVAPQDCFRCDWLCIKDEPDCVTNVTVDLVWHEVLQCVQRPGSVAGGSLTRDTRTERPERKWKATGERFTA